MDILFSSEAGPENEASANPARVLAEEWFSEKGGEFRCGAHRMMDAKVRRILDVPVGFESDGVVVLSPHRSEREYPSLTVHVPGNWDCAQMGGEARTLNTVMAGRMREILRGLYSGNEKYSLGWNVSMEADHHGPTCKSPIMFVEIGSSEKEWGNETAAKIVAEAVMRTLEWEGECDSYFCVGGGHYCPKFSKMGLEGERAAGHVLPKYGVETLGMDTFSQAMEKSVEETCGVLIEKKGINAAQREIVEKFAKEYGAEVELLR
ncbi:D-aminoacyl-tRNA deacylase [Candidatus Micrarchaeota archaeon]|nr:D-aminoacyl-tRNA deacylase [Candidatus Micrarchaeota archaeon]